MAPGDRSNETGPLQGPARRTWAALFVLHRRVLREVERRLAEAGLPPLVWYDALYSLYAAEESTLLQRDLAERIMFSPSGMSRLIDRMAERGVVCREEIPGDRRATRLRLTSAGVDLMREMWVHYGGVVEEHFAPAVAGHEGEMSQMLEAALASLEAVHGPAPG